MIVLENTPPAILVLAIGVMFATGVYLLLDRPLTRVLLGFVLIGNGVNLRLLVMGGRSGASPIIGNAPDDVRMSDPLAQAMVLTSIVITLALTAFVLAMAYRSWQLHGHDEVADDVEDRRVARHAALNAPAFEDADAGGFDQTLDEEAADAFDDVDDSDDGREPTSASADHRADRPEERP